MGNPELPSHPDAPSGQRPGRVASAAKPVAALVAASLLGGSAALGGAWALGAFDDPRAEAHRLRCTHILLDGGAAGAPRQLPIVLKSNTFPSLIADTQTMLGHCVGLRRARTAPSPIPNMTTPVCELLNM